MFALKAKAKLILFLSLLVKYYLYPETQNYEPMFSGGFYCTIQSDIFMSHFEGSQ